MHDNANISCALAETYTNFDIILSLQPRMTTSGGKTREDLIIETAKEIAQSLPELYDIEAAQMKYPTRYDESMNTVIVQEAQRYNNLLGVMKRTLVEVQKGLKGLVVLSSELEAMSNSLYDQKVPAVWEAKAYPSLKPLGAWVVECLERLQFIGSWLDNGIPDVFWISGFFFPQVRSDVTASSSPISPSVRLSSLLSTLLWSPLPLSVSKRTPCRAL